MNLFITGTSTEVGKTYVTSLLLRALVNAGHQVAPWKPVCCGVRDDVFRLLEASGSERAPDEINPIWLKSSVAPLAAAMIENRKIDFDHLVALTRAEERPDRHLLVEGAGGWEVPLTEERTMADFAQVLGYPAVIVVDNKLGALNHTILTVRRMEQLGVPLKGLILNQTQDERDAASISNRHILDTFLQVPILADVMFDDTEIDIDLKSLLEI